MSKRTPRTPDTVVPPELPDEGFKDSPVQRILSRVSRESVMIGLVALTIYLAMALLSYNPTDPGWQAVGHNTAQVTNYAGYPGAWIASLLIVLLGHVAYLFPLMVGYQVIHLYRHREPVSHFSWSMFGLRFAGILLMLLTATSLLALYPLFGLDANAGGKIGGEIKENMVRVFNVPATTLILVSVLLFALTIVTELSWIRVMDRLGEWTVAFAKWLAGHGREDELREPLHQEPGLTENNPSPEAVEASQTAPAGIKSGKMADPPLLQDKVDHVGETAAVSPANDTAEDDEYAAGWLARLKANILPSKRDLRSDRIEPVFSPAELREPVSRLRTPKMPDDFDLDDLEPFVADHHADIPPRHASPAPSSKASATRPPAVKPAVPSASEPEVKAPVLKIEPFKRTPEAPANPVVPSPQVQWDDGGGPIPPLTLLDAPEQNQKPGYSRESLEHMSRLLEEKLNDFGVNVEVVEVNPGPVITRFEIRPAPGVKVSRISNLAKDLARSLAVISVRVVEVIPGKSVVGIEIPNESRQIVRLREVLASPAFDDASSALTMALGNDIAGNPVVANLAKMPHLLVAGTTGSGKSVGVNAMLLSMLLKATPEDLRFIMVDPKMLELSIYEGIPHLLTPVVTDMKEAANALRWCVAEMERRYRLMAALGVRNIAGYNRKVKDAEQAGEPLRDPIWRVEESVEGVESARPELTTLPCIVVVIDEFADMMMIVGKKVEELIARIAQKARAAGIHLILATQRPSVDVITGLIKANIPTRMSFQVSSKIDSRTVLDQGGAEQLLGHGDMLYLPPGSGLPIRVHGAFVADDEVHRVVSAWKQRGEPDYIDDVLTGGESDGGCSGQPGSGGSGEGGDEADPIYDEAVLFVTESRRVSISSVQRKFKIGYNRAANLVDAMEASGVVSSAGHNGSRDVLAPPPPRD